MGRNLSIRRTPPRHTFTLPRAVQARLALFCAEHGERPLDVVIDAVALHLDELDDIFSRASRTAPDDARDREHRTAEAGTGGDVSEPPRLGGSPPSDDQVVDLPRFLGRRSP